MDGWLAGGYVCQHAWHFEQGSVCVCACVCACVDAGTDVWEYSLSLPLCVAYLVVVAPNGVNDALELIAYIQLVRIEKQKYKVAAGGKPLAHVDEIVGALDPLLLAREHAGRVHEGDVLEEGVGALGALEPA